MAELEEKLSAILSDPEAMGQIVSIAKSLTGASSPSSTPEEIDGYTPVEHPSPMLEDTAVPQSEAAGAPDLSALTALLSGTADADGLGSLLGGLDPALLQTAMQLFSAYGAQDDRRTALLSALRPFLKEERREKMDKAIQIAKLSRVIRVAFRLFKKEVDEEDV